MEVIYLREWAWAYTQWGQGERKCFLLLFPKPVYFLVLGLLKKKRKKEHSGKYYLGKTSSLQLQHEKALRNGSSAHLIVIVISQRLQGCFMEDGNSIISQSNYRGTDELTLFCRPFTSWHLGQKRENTQPLLSMLFSPPYLRTTIPSQDSRHLWECKLLPVLSGTFRRAFRSLHKEIKTKQTKPNMLYK